MTTERIQVDLDELEDDVGLTDDEIQESIQQEQAENQSEEATGVEDAQDASDDIFQKAAESLNGTEEPDVVTRADLDGAFSRFAETFKNEIAELRNNGAAVPVEEPTNDIDEQAFEQWLNAGEFNATPEEVAQSKAEFRAFKNRLQQETNTNNDISEKIASIEQKIDNLANQRSVQQNAWSPEDAQHINNSLTYLGAAHGLNIDFNNQAQAAAVLNGVQPGEDPRIVMQKINQNMERIKNNANPNIVDTTNNVAGTTAANVPSLGGAPTNNDYQAYNDIDEIRLAIANNEIPVEDYAKYVAQLS